MAQKGEYYGGFKFIGVLVCCVGTPAAQTEGGGVGLVGLQPILRGTPLFLAIFASTAMTVVMHLYSFIPYVGSHLPLEISDYAPAVRGRHQNSNKQQKCLK